MIESQGMKHLGCGVAKLVVIHAPGALSVPGIITLVVAVVSVRQTALTSCSLFINFVDKLIKMTKDKCEYGRGCTF